MRLPRHLRKRLRAAADYHGVSEDELLAELEDGLSEDCDIEDAEDFLEPLEEYYGSERLSAHERHWLGYE